MFGNKKNNLPPRPHHPLAEQILEDVTYANKDDVVFRLGIKEYPVNPSDTESVYERLKTYWSVKESLSELSETLREENQLLEISDLEMKKMAEDIRRQAQEALIKQ